MHFQLAREIPDKRRIAHATLEGVALQPPSTVDDEGVVGRARAVAFYVLIRLPILLSCWVLWKSRNPIPLLLYVFLSTLTIMFYGADKKRAMTSRWRIPESYLHILELLGGWPGALLAQKDFRHKLTKSSYQRIFWAIIVLHGALWSAYLAFGLSLPELLRAIMEGLGDLLFPRAPS
ncbi:MAG: DUF1294 domain-containing protein [Methylotetracoccus sp.]